MARCHVLRLRYLAWSVLATCVALIGGDEATTSSRTLFTEHHGVRIHVVTFARPGKFLVHLAVSVHRCGGVLNVLGTRDDVAPIPEEFKVDDEFRKDLDFQFAYGAGEDGRKENERGYRRILFKRLLFLWRLAARLPPRDLLLYIDGNDVLFQQPLDTIVASYLSLTRPHPDPALEPALFMGYSICGGRFHGDHAHVRYPLLQGASVLGSEACKLWARSRRSGSMRYLDTGGYIGRAAAVHALLDDGLEMARLGLDHICMSLMHMTALRLGASRLRVDTQGHIFYSLTPPAGHDTFANWSVQVSRPLCEAGYFDETGRPPEHAATGETPAILHFVGPAKWYHLQRCADAFAQRRWAELTGAVEVSTGFAGKSMQYCELRCLPGRDCEDLGCVQLDDVFGYFDMDVEEFQTYPLTAIERLL